MATERKAKSNETGIPCAKCGKPNATRLVDVHGAVKILGQKMCTKCCNKILVEYPASSAVQLRNYER